MKCSKNSGIMFLAVGAAFLALGASQTAFLGVGIAFLVLGISLMGRSRRCSLKLK